jgi:DNA repair protein RadA/Sms
MMSLGPISQLVDGAVTLVYGHPGVGKSTLITQVVSAASCDRVLYASNMESAAVIDARVQRVRKRTFGDGSVSPWIEAVVERDIDNLIERASSTRAKVLIVDTILLMTTPKLRSKPGSPSQVRVCTDRLVDFAKSAGIPMFLVGYATKAGYFAGPIQLEHSVDSVFALKQHPTNTMLRVLRCSKNRYGSCQRVILELRDTGFCLHGQGNS